MPRLMPTYEPCRVGREIAWRRVFRFGPWTWRGRKLYTFDDAFDKAFDLPAKGGETK